jgi:uncharacterized protein (DUF1800 family)
VDHREAEERGSGFRFEPRMHEPGDKTVLGHKIKENGEKEAWKFCAYWRAIRRRRASSHKSWPYASYPTIPRQR